MHHTQLKSCGCFKDYKKTKQRHYFDEKQKTNIFLEESDAINNEELWKCNVQTTPGYLTTFSVKNKTFTTTYMCAGVCVSVYAVSNLLTTEYDYYH